jgi:hypothetical protein
LNTVVPGGGSDLEQTYNTSCGRTIPVGTVPVGTTFDTSFTTPTATVATSATQAAGTTVSASATGTASTRKTSGAGKVAIVFVAATMVAIVGGAFIGI